MRATAANTISLVGGVAWKRYDGRDDESRTIVRLRITGSRMLAWATYVDVLGRGEMAISLDVASKIGSTIYCECHFENRYDRDGVANLLVVCDAVETAYVPPKVGIDKPEAMLELLTRFDPIGYLEPEYKSEEREILEWIKENLSEIRELKKRKQRRIVTNEKRRCRKEQERLKSQERE